ncbi:MAG: superoxide dismutase [Parachlamydiales bacterium]|jgi:Fe-Mn family superoxide dismutase
MTNYQLPDLRYDFDGLEPVFTKEMLEIHYNKHHRAYVNKLNEALEKYHEAEIKNDAEKMVELQGAIKFNGGGHINHSIFWQILSPEKNGGGHYESDYEIIKAIEKDFHSFENFKNSINEISLGIQGSGWGWLGYDKKINNLVVESCSNHDLLSAQGIFPIFCIDVWEHAYYLKYKNDRAGFIKDIYKILNWKEINERYIKIFS